MVLSDTSKSIMVCIVAVSAVALGVGVFFAADAWVYFKGLAFGTIITLLKTVLLERTVNKALDMNKHKADSYMRLHYMLRYTITGVVLVVAALEDSISLIGLIIGLLAMRPAVYIVSWRMNNNQKKQKTNS